MNLLQTIQSHEKDFSKAEKKVFDYIIKYPETVETNTISKIAIMANTSTSAVLRFCQALGFNGYKDFRYEMINCLYENHINTNPSDIIQQFTQDYRKTLNQFPNLDRELINKLLLQLKEKKHIYITGIHYSSLPARLLAMGLQDLGILSHCAYDYFSISHLLNVVEDDSLYINFSLSGNVHTTTSLPSEFESNLPKNSFLVTCNPQSKTKLFKNIIILPGRSINRQSIVENQSMPIIFVEMLLNLLHASY